MKFDFLGTPNVLRRNYLKFSRYFVKGSSVLDIGCGSGVFLEVLNEKGIKGVGVDICDEYINHCRNKSLEVYKEDGITFLKNSKINFDGVFASHIVEHFEPDEVLEFLKLAYEKLNKSGKIILITPNTRDLDVITERFWLDLSHKRPYPLVLLEKLFAETGFKVLDKGEDKDTVPKFKISLKAILREIRFSPYIRRGDYFIVGEKLI